ncbi:MerR family transcriptional regulator, partial [Streptococcus gordonii]|nr:MerR family transcriptional regulator [Streptococcus gordonii]
MSYTVKSLSEMAGVSVRTLHYYEEVGLLSPKRSASNYRIYDEADVQRLQQILLYRDAGMALEEIRRVLDAPGFDVRDALHEHLERLERRRD